MQQIVACSHALPPCVLVPTVESVNPMRNDKGLHRSGHAQPYAEDMGAGFRGVDATHRPSSVHGPLLAECGPLRLLTDRWHSGQTDDYSPLIASIGQIGSGEVLGLLRIDMSSTAPLSSTRSVTPDGRVTRLKVGVRSRCNIRNIQ